MALVPMYYFKGSLNSYELLKILMTLVPIYYFKDLFDSYELLKILMAVSLCTILKVH